MKKIFIILAITGLLASCSTSTSTDEDTEMLQKSYSTVYRMTGYRYICIDSSNTIYDVTVTIDGNIKSRVKIK